MVSRFTSLLLCIVNFTRVHAYPTGPGSCDSPVPLGGPHGYDFGMKALSEVGLEVRIDGNALKPSTPFSFASGKSYTLEIIAAETKFRGVLMKLYKSGIDTSTMLTTTDIDAGKFCLVVTTRHQVLGTVQSSSSPVSTLHFCRQQGLMGLPWRSRP